MFIAAASTILIYVWYILSIMLLEFYQQNAEGTKNRFKIFRKILGNQDMTKNVIKKSMLCFVVLLSKDIFIKNRLHRRVGFCCFIYTEHWLHIWARYMLVWHGKAASHFLKIFFDMSPYHIYTIVCAKLKCSMVRDAK